MILLILELKFVSVPSKILWNCLKLNSTENSSKSYYLVTLVKILKFACRIRSPKREKSQKREKKKPKREKKPKILPYKLRIHKIFFENKIFFFKKENDKFSLFSLAWDKLRDQLKFIDKHYLFFILPLSKYLVEF